MVETVTVTHELLISTDPVLFAGLQAPKEQGPKKCSSLLELDSDSIQLQNGVGVSLPFGGGQSFHMSPKGAFICPL